MRTALALIALAAAPVAFAQDALPKNPGNEPLAQLPALPEPEPAASFDSLADRAASDPALAPVMDRVEKAVAMPAAARPIADYARFYSWADAGRTKVTAVYLLGGSSSRKWIGFDELPMPIEAGCAYVSLVFDTPTGRVEELDCAPG